MCFYLQFLGEDLGYLETLLPKEADEIVELFADDDIQLFEILLTLLLLENDQIKSSG